MLSILESKQPIKVIVKDSEWQKIRVSLLGKWKKEPEWCCKQIESYITPIDKIDYDKLRIVMNYLVGSGFRMGKIKHPCITNLRNRISIEMKRRKQKTGVE